MDNKIVNVHDKFFKATFGDIEVATDFLKSYLPSEVLETIDLNTIETQNGSFVDNKLKEQFSDLLFKVSINNRAGYVYLLFEHKSYNDKLAILQLLRYIIEIWESKITKEKQEELPIILPLLIYHNDKEWTAKTKLSDWIEGYDFLPNEIKKYIPNYEYLLYDLSNYSEDEVRLGIRANVVMKMLSKGRYATEEEARELAKEALRLLVKIKVTDRVTNIVEACIRYLLDIRDDITEEELQEIGNEIAPEGSDLVMTVAEKLRQEGLERGMELGELKRAKKSARTGITKGYSIEIIMDMTGLTEEEIKNIKKEMLK